MKTKKISNLLKALQAYRLDKRMSYSKVGEAMGYRKHTVMNWLLGRHKPSQLAEAAILHFLTARQEPTIKEKNKCKSAKKTSR